MSKPGSTAVAGDSEASRGKAASLTDSELVDETESMVISDAGPEESTGNKAKMVLSILRQCLRLPLTMKGVKDMASVRFSLPSQLIEPIPNLEYWNYLDRPDYFLCINDSEDSIERMISLLRWYLTKDLKLVHGKICKPYNSVLGEFFRCTWTSTAVPTTSLNAAMLEAPAAEPSPVVKQASRFKPSFSRKSTPAQAPQTSNSVPSTRSTSPTPSLKSNKSVQNAEVHVPLSKPIRTAFLCEQTSHHPPVSAYYYSCPERNIEAYGMDQIASKFTGTTIKVQPGEQNEGIFVNLINRQEEYRCTHPTASICGFLRGSLYAAVQDSALISCEKTGLKAILVYKDEPWIGKPKYAIEGVVFKYNPKTPGIEQIRDVPEDAIIARIEGCWKNKIYISSAKSTVKHLLIDVSDLTPAGKTVPNLSVQHSNESRNVWDSVTQSILSKRFEQATRNKTEIEDEQRKIAKERAERNEVFIPKFFIVNENGKPTLTEAGRRMIQGQHDESWST